MSNNFSFPYRIYYEDTDAGGIVYYANYLKFFERARTEFLRSLNIVQSDLMVQENLVFVVRKCHIDYILPAKMDDLVEVTVEVTKIHPASITMFQEMVRAGKVLSRLTVQVACVSADGIRPERIPGYIVQLLTNKN